MPTPKDAIVEALQSLDHNDDTQWTDDGAPLVAKVAIICNDLKLTRQEINDALPGFVRKSNESVEEPADDKDEFGDPVVSAAAVVAHSIMAPPAKPELVPDEPPTDEAEYERLRLIARSRVDDAEKAVTDAKAAIADAQQGLRGAEARLTRALQLYASRYPAISAAENIKQHLKRQQEELRLRVTGSKFEPNVAANPIDVTMMDRKRDNGRNGKGQQQQKPSFLPRKSAVNY